MRGIFDAIRQKRRTRSVGARKQMWNREYASSFAERMKLTEEREHYQTLVEFMVSANKNRAILDVCCGQGLLLDSLETCGYQKYLGIDFSDIALRNASKRANSKTSFVNALAESFVPDGQFDAIVFNECLYYLADPLGVMRRFERYLAPDGVMLVSLFTKTERVELLAAQISQSFRVTRRASVTNGTGTWKCSMLTMAP